MTAVDLVGDDVEPIANDLSQPLGREETIVSAEQEPDGDCRPAIQRPRLVGDGLRLLSSPCLCLLCQVPRHVVIEDRDRIRVVHVASGLGVAGVLPVFVGGLTRPGDHAGDENEKLGPPPGADDRSREPTERLGHDDEAAAVADRVAYRVRIPEPTCGLVFAREVDGDDFVTAPSQFGRNEVPVPRHVARAVDQDIRYWSALLTPGAPHPSR